MLKINNDLERIGDLAVNIAEQAREISKAPAVAIPFDFSGMVVNVKKMLHGCLDAMVNLDLNCAWLILGSDDEVDARHREMYIKIQEKIVQDPKQVATYIRYLSVSRGLERIGDYATNIAQDVIYTIQGNIVRHQHSECAPPDRVE
jgi:phosphate transport system protein